MPLKQHPTNPDMMIYTKAEYGKISVGKPWVGLTDDEVEKIIYNVRVETVGVITTELLVRAIEAKLKEKNNG